MIFKSPIISEASGSMAGCTFSRNRGGPFIRARVTPVNPNSTYQQTVRSLMSQGSSLWSDTLTDAQRAAWDTYALNVPLPNRLGDPINVGGIGMYQRCNVGRLNPQEATLLRINDAPTIYDLGPYTAPAIASISAAADTLDVSFTDTDAWANETGAAMIIAVSRPTNPAINYFKGPYRFAEAVLGDDTTAPTSPVTVTAPFPIAAGQKVFAFVRVTRLDGRLSASFRDGAIAV